jgi:hypothetical protein
MSLSHRADTFESTVAANNSTHWQNNIFFGVLVHGDTALNLILGKNYLPLSFVESFEHLKICLRLARVFSECC